MPKLVPSNFAIENSESDIKRSTSIFNLLQDKLRIGSNNSSKNNTIIPKVIIQFWDKANSNPSDVKKCMESWESLKEEGYTLGIVSSKKKDMVEYGVQLIGLENQFEVIVGYDEVKKHKPSPEGIFIACKQLGYDHDNCIYVGDTSTDILAANNAGLYSVAYLTHPERRDAILDAKPNATIENLNELKELLKKDITWTRSLT